MSTAATNPMLLELEDQKHLSGQSLNEGLDDGEDNIVDPYFTFETMPNYDEEVQVFVSTESRINDLVYLANAIEQTKGMTRSFAMEAEALLPGFGGVPMGFYTESPTQTRYKVSLEEISKGMWGIIAAAAAAVIALITKLIMWLSGKRNGAGGADSNAATSNVEELSKEFQDIPETLKKTSELFDEGNAELQQSNITLRTGKGEEYQCKSFSDLIKNTLINSGEEGSRKIKFLKSTEPFLNDLVHNGEYSSLIHAIGTKLTAINTTMKAKLDMIGKIYIKDIDSVGGSKEHMENIFDMAVVTKSFEVSVLGHEYTLRELADKITSTRQSVERKVISESLNFDKTFARMSYGYSSKAMDRILNQLSQTVDVITEVKKRYETLEQVCMRREHDGNSGNLTKEMGDDVRGLISIFGRELAALGRISAEIMTYCIDLRRIANSVISTSLEIIELAYSDMKKNNQTIPDGWLRLIEKVKIERKAITKAHRFM